jgi:hypothetical protein
MHYIIPPSKHRYPVELTPQKECTIPLAAWQRLFGHWTHSRGFKSPLPPNSSLLISSSSFFTGHLFADDYFLL